MSKEDWAGIGIIFLVALAVMLPQLVSRSYFSVLLDDAETFTGWAWQFVEGLREGIAYPRWTPLNFWGYGSPTFLLYPPLAYYLTALFNVFTGSVIAAMDITKFLSLFLYGVGMFLLVREFYSTAIARLVSVFLMIFPYVVYQFYFIGTFASVVALMWFPYLVLFTRRYLSKGNFKYALYAGACYGGLILTHLINAYMFTFVLAAFIVYMSLVRRQPALLLGFAAIIVVGVMISCAYLLPLILEKRFVNLKAFLEYFPIDIPSYISPAKMAGTFPRDINEIFILVSCMFLALFLSGLKSSRTAATGKEDVLSGFLAGVALVSIFLLFRISAFLWETVPFFKYIQFSWRWFNIASFAIVFLLAPFLALKGSGGRIGRLSVFAVVLFSLCILVDYRCITLAHAFHEASLIPPGESHWTPEHLPAGVDPNKVYKEGRNRVFVTDGEGTAAVKEWMTAERVVAVEARTPLTLKIRTFNFPGWTALLDGVRTPVAAEKDTGAMLVRCPKGRHSLELSFVDTPVRYYSKIVSLAAVLSLLLYALNDLLRSRRRMKRGSGVSTSRI